MGVAFAGIVRTPLTSVIMIFEMTRDYTIIVPLMISNLIAFFISYKLQHEPIYEALATQDGVHLPTVGGPGATAAAAGKRCDDDAGRRSPAANADSGGDERRKGPIVVAINTDCGAFSIRRSWRRLCRKAGSWRDLFHGTPDEDIPHLHTDHSLAIALDRMGSSKLRVLPVVSRANVRQLVGLVTLEAVLHAYGFSAPPTA